MKIKLLYFVILSTSSFQIIAQSSDTIVYGEKIRYLEINKVSTPILGRGDMSWNLIKAGYEVPKGTGKKSIFASALWIGGIVNGNLKLAA